MVVCIGFLVPLYPKSFLQIFHLGHMSYHKHYGLQVYTQIQFNALDSTENETHLLPSNQRNLILVWDGAPKLLLEFCLNQDNSCQSCGHHFGYKLSYFAILALPIPPNFSENVPILLLKEVIHHLKTHHLPWLQLSWQTL